MVCLNITVGFVGTMADQFVEEGVLFLRSQNILPYSLNLEPTQIKFISKRRIRPDMEHTPASFKQWHL